MVWKLHQNGGQLLAKKDIPVDTSWQEEKRKTATIMEEPSDRLHEKQKHGRRHGGRQTSLAFRSGWTALGCIDSNNKKESKQLLSDFFYQIKQGVSLGLLNFFLQSSRTYDFSSHFLHHRLQKLNLTEITHLLLPIALFQIFPIGCFI